MATYRGSHDANGAFRIRTVPLQPEADARRQSSGSLAKNTLFRHLYQVCLALGIAAPSSTPVTREVAVAALTAKNFNTEGLADHAVQRIYDLSSFKRAELVEIMERYFELHDLMEV